MYVIEKGEPGADAVVFECRQMRPRVVRQIAAGLRGAVGGVRRCGALDAVSLEGNDRGVPSRLPNWSQGEPSPPREHFP